MIAASASAVGSEVFSLVALLVFSILTLLILRFYLPLRTTPAFVLVTVFFALWLPAGIVLLVPIDLASSARTDDEATRGIWLPERAIQTCWRIVYWLIFVLTWYVALLFPAVSHTTNQKTGSFSPSSPNTPTPGTENRKTNCYTPFDRTHNITP